MKLAEAKSVHDALLAVMPEGESHAPCELCSVGVSNETAAENAAPANRKEDNSMDPIYTQEQADSLIEAAVTKANETASVELASTVEAKDTRIAELEAEVASLQEKRDQDQVELAAAQARVTELETEIASREQEVAKEARKAERLAAVTELKVFSEKYVSENVARWVEMDEEQFASYLKDVAEMASALPATPAPVDDTVPEETAMSNEQVETPKVSALKSVFTYSALKGGNQ